MKFVEPRPFADPDVAARKLVEIANALPKAKQDQPEWWLAVTTLMQAAEEGAPVMLAAIAMLRALNAGGEPPDRPEPRWKRAKKYRIVR